MELPRDLRVGWDKMISREMQLEMWKIENQGVRKSLDELAQRYSAPGDEWRRHLPSMPLSLDRSSQTDASELQPVSEMDDERRLLRKELEKLRSESEDALRRQKLFYEAQLSKVGPELRAQAQKQVRSLELEMEERVRAVRTACRVQLRNELARATAQLRRGAGHGCLTEAQVQVDAGGDDAERIASQLSSVSAGAADPPASESREWWTQEREQLLHEAACRLQRQTNTLRRMAARIDQLEDQLAVARIKEEGTKLETRRRGGALLTSAEAELRLEAVRRHVQRLETALEARRREAEEAHSEAVDLRRQLALVQGCAALRGHWLGAGELPPLSGRGEQLLAGEAAPQPLTSWSRLAAEEATPPQKPDRPQTAWAGEREEPHQERACSPLPKSAGTGSTDSLERESTTGDDCRRSVTRESAVEVDEPQQAWRADAGRLTASPGHGAAEERLYLQNVLDEEVWDHQMKRNATTEANASGQGTQPNYATRDAGSIDRAVGPSSTDDDGDVVTENLPYTETVENSLGTFSESKSQNWQLDHKKIEATGRLGRIDTIISPRSQVVHHVVDIEPDFTTDFRRSIPRRRSRFGGGLGRMEEEAGYPIKYSVPSQQISSFTYSTDSGCLAWPSTYTERNVDSAGAAQGTCTVEVGESAFDKVRDSKARDTPRTPRSSGARSRMTKARFVKSKKTWSKPSDVSKASSDTSSVESGDPEPTSACYYDRMAQRMGGGQAPGGADAWSGSPLHSDDVHGVRRAAWRRRGLRTSGSLSQQSADELQEIDRRRRQGQIQHIEDTATGE